MSERLLQLQLEIEAHLERIERLLPKTYTLTLLARNREMGDADILMTMDDLECVIAAIKQLRPRDPINQPGAFPLPGTEG